MRNRMIAVLVLLVPNLASAQASSLNPVFVDAQDPGRGFAVARNSECFVLTAGHVVMPKTANGPRLPLGASFQIIGHNAQRSTARFERLLEPHDVAILRIRENQSLCNGTSWPDVPGADRAQVGQLIEVSGLTTSGSVVRRPGTLTIVDGDIMELVVLAGCLQRWARSGAAASSRSRAETSRSAS